MDKINNNNTPSNKYLYVYIYFLNKKNIETYLHNIYFVFNIQWLF